MEGLLRILVSPPSALYQVSGESARGVSPTTEPLNSRSLCADAAAPRGSNGFAISLTK